MIYYDNGYKMSTTKVHYIEEHEGEIIKFVGLEGKDYWEDFHEREIIELKGFEDVDIYNEEQRERLNKVNELKIEEGTPLVENYILTGDFNQDIEVEDREPIHLEVKEGHPLYVLKLEDEVKRLEAEVSKANAANKTSMVGLFEVNNRLRALEGKKNEVD